MQITTLAAWIIVISAIINIIAVALWLIVYLYKQWQKKDEEKRYTEYKRQQARKRPVKDICTDYRKGKGVWRKDR